MPVVPILSALVSLALMASLPLPTWERLIIWMAIGIAIYFGYGYRHSELRKRLAGRRAVGRAAGRRHRRAAGSAASAGPWLAVALLSSVSARTAPLGYVLIEGWHPWDALLHDRHHHHDGRLQGSAPALPRRRGLHRLRHPRRRRHRVLHLHAAGHASWSKAACTRASSAGGACVCWTNSATISSSAATAASAPSSSRNSGASSVPYVVIERDPERVQAVIERRRPGGRGRRQQRRGADARWASTGRAGSLRRSAPTRRTSTPCSRPACSGPDLYIIGRAETEDAERKLLRAGANRVVSPYRIGARELAQTALRPAVVDFFQLATRSGQPRTGHRAGGDRRRAARLAGQSIIDANVRQRFGLIVVGIQRAGGKMEFNPPGDAVMQAGDQLVVLGRADGLRELERPRSAAQGADGDAHRPGRTDDERTHGCSTVDGNAVAPRSATNSSRGWRRSTPASGARQGWASSWPATTRPPRSTCATSSRRPARPASAPN